MYITLDYRHTAYIMVDSLESVDKFIPERASKGIEIYSILPCICSVIDHRRCQNVVGTSVTNLPAAHWPLFGSDHILMESPVIYN